MHQHAAQIDRRGFIAGAAAATALVAAAPLASKAHADEAGRPASMEVYIIDNGEMTLPDSQMYQGGDGSLTTFPMYTVLIKHPEATVLFDAAKNTYVDRNAPSTFDLIDIAPEQEYPACLEALGMTPDDIDILVLSHLHGDHMGYADLFTNAKVYVAEREFEYTARGLGEGVMPGADDLNAMYGVPLRWQLVPEDVAEVELLPGITIHNFGIGHSFGMLGLMVELPETGNVLMPSDACCYLANLDKENRLLPPERVTDYERTVAAFDVISDLAEKNNAQVWPAHDPEWFSTMTLASEGYYA